MEEVKKLKQKDLVAVYSPSEVGKEQKALLDVFATILDQDASTTEF